MSRTVRAKGAESRVVRRGVVSEVSVGGCGVAFRTRPKRTNSQMPAIRPTTPPIGPMSKKAPMAMPPSRSGPASAITSAARADQPASAPSRAEKRPRIKRMSGLVARMGIAVRTIPKDRVPSPDPVQAVPDGREDAADVFSQAVERVEIVEDAGEAVLDLALALGQRVDARGEADVAARLDLADGFGEEVARRADVRDHGLDSEHGRLQWDEVSLRLRQLRLEGVQRRQRFLQGAE